MGRGWFKAGLNALLIGNTSVYLWRGTPSEALDSLAWLVLLLSFQAETGRDGLRARAEWQFFAILPRADRALAAAWWAVLLLRGLLPAALAVAMGVLVLA